MIEKPKDIASWIQKETNCEKELVNRIEARITRMVIDRDLEREAKNISSSDSGALPQALVSGNDVLGVALPSDDECSKIAGIVNENGKCLHNVGSQNADGYFRCLYCGSVVEDLANYR